MVAHAAFPGQVDSSLLHATSSAQAVTWLQQDDPRHFWHGPKAAICVQNVASSGSQSPPSSDESQMQGRPPAQSAATEHVG
jgi:hypothetical protein